MPKLVIHKNGDRTTLSVPGNITLLEALRQHGFSLETPCNGRGVCGKCRLRIHNQCLSYTEEEKVLLTPGDTQKGVHLACMTRVTQNMEITLEPDTGHAHILTDITIAQVSGAPEIRKIFLCLPIPSLTDQSADDERLLTSWKENAPKNLQSKGNTASAYSNGFSLPSLPLTVLQRLPETLRRSGFEVTLIETQGQLTGVEAGNTMQLLYGIAIDIGTTTLAAYLYDLNEGKQVAVASRLNPQKKHGADVISRIDYASAGNERSDEMAQLIRGALNDLILQLVQASGLKENDIYLITLAGNTTMIHLLLRLPAAYIAVAPFIPVTLDGFRLPAFETGLSMNPSGHVIILPSVSAYVGADTVAAVLSTGMHRKKEITLLVDIGTNGEIVLGNESTLYACSTAAGPAFEGANISCGIGGVEGALSAVSVLADGTLSIETIGGKQAVGICGSGLIDAIACMLQIGIMDATGRILEEDELSESALQYSERFVIINGQQAFCLVPPGLTGHGEAIVITQRDVREVQNAKAAIAAGISILIRQAGFEMNQIQSVSLAGGFGSFLRISSAIKIGLLPEELSGRVYAAGNAAGAGAIYCLLSMEELSQAEKIAGMIQYLELSSRPDFVLAYTDNMFFGNEQD